MPIQILYKDESGTEVRCSSVKQHDALVSFGPIAIKSVIQGTETYHFRQNVFRAQSKKVVLGNKYTNARVLIDSEEDVKGVCIDFSQHMIDSFLNEFQYSAAFKEQILMEQHFSGELKSQSLILQKNIFNLLQSLESPLSTNEIEQQLYSLMQTYFDIQQFRFHHANKLDFKKNETRVFNADKILDAQSYILQHLQNDIHLDQLAAEVGLSKFQLLRVFRDTFKVTPHQFIIQTRLEKAKALLDKLPINEVAQTVGFADASSFGKAFRNHFGLTPTAYKAK
jgi:AraC-like DNA-binding protein